MYEGRFNIDWIHPGEQEPDEEPRLHERGSWEGVADWVRSQPGYKEPTEEDIAEARRRNDALPF